MYPLAVILVTGILPLDRRVLRYALPFAIFGWMTALYHLPMYTVISPESLQPCGTCRAFHPIVKGILRDHPVKVNLVVRYLPLHPGSEEVVKILKAARLQGKIWEALGAGYATQEKWAINHQVYPEFFWRSITRVGLDPEQISKAMQSPAVARNIRQDAEDARALGVDKTPGFFVNGKPLIEFGQRQLLQLVNQALKSEYGG